MDATVVEFESAGIVVRGDRRGHPDHPPIVFLHGGGQTRHSWGGAAAELASQGWLTYSVDARGHGDSDWAPGGDYSLDAFAEDVIAIVERVGVPPVLVGASLGGLASIVALGRLRPDLARGLVLVDSLPTLEKSGTERIGEFLRAHLADGFASLKEAAAAVTAYNPHRPTPPDPEGLRKNLRERDGRWYWHWDPAFVGGTSPAAALDAAYLMECAKAIDIPILLIRGRMSDVVSEENARAFVEEIPNAELVDVADAAHMVAGDRNDVFTRAVIDFLQTLD